MKPNILFPFSGDLRLFTLFYTANDGFRPTEIWNKVWLWLKAFISVELVKSNFQFQK